MIRQSRQWRNQFSHLLKLQLSNTKRDWIMIIWSQLLQLLMRNSSSMRMLTKRDKLSRINSISQIKQEKNSEITLKKLLKESRKKRKRTLSTKKYWSMRTRVWVSRYLSSLRCSLRKLRNLMILSRLYLWERIKSMHFALIKPIFKIIVISTSVNIFKEKILLRNSWSWMSS